MYLQVQNTVKSSHNIIRSSKETLVKDIKRQGWNIQDCTVKEIRPELVDAKYRGADGKNIPSGQKQYKTRAKSRGNLNMK
jgi:hypothetical protein